MDAATFGLRVGRVGPLSLHLSRQAMGLRQVTDLSDYTISELLLLIQLATSILRQRLGGAEQQSASVDSDLSSGASVIEPEVPAPAAKAKASSPTTVAQSSAASSQVDAGFEAPVIWEPPTRLRHPWTCEYHCKFCQVQCCRPGPHTNHACVEHRRLR